MKLKSWQLCGAAALGFTALVSGVLSMPLRASVPGDVTWLPDYAGARGIARQSGKPLFVAFR